jgi:hypothetical protein
MTTAKNVNNWPSFFDLKKRTSYPFIFPVSSPESGAISHWGSTPAVILPYSFPGVCGKVFQLLAREPVSGPVFDGLQLDAIQN